MQAVYQGSGTALVTPFRNGQIDWKALARLIDRQIEQGTQALVIAGTTGEPSTLTRKEKRELFDRCAELIAGRVPMIAGTGGNDTREVISDTRYAKEAGADACLVVTPYYNKTTQRGLVLHYAEVDAASELPLIVYNVPSRTAMNITPQTMAEIARLPRVAGLKDAASDIRQTLQTIRLCPGLPVYSGADEMNYPILCAGGAGCISVTANVYPDACRAFTDAMAQGRWKDALCLQLKLDPVTEALFSETSPIPVKAALAMKGLCTDEVRAPLYPMAESGRTALRLAMEAFEA